MDISKKFAKMLANAPTKEELYTNAFKRPENMSNWLDQMIQAKADTPTSDIQIPDTQIITLPLEQFTFLRSDNYTDDAIREFGQFIVDNMHSELKAEQKLFMKTGTFSGKFEFENAVVDVQAVLNDPFIIGQQFLNIFYTGMLVGAGDSPEIVLRKFIPNTENRPTIYNGMALHTEFRVFYDFDKKEPVSIANYWHPDVMATGVYANETDLHTYDAVKDTMVTEFNTHKSKIVSTVSELASNTNDINGRWSIDVLLTNGTPYIIDMARMHVSALVDNAEPVDTLA